MSARSLNAPASLSALAMLSLLLLAAASKPNDLTMTPEQQKTVGLQTTAAVRRAITESVRAAGTVAFDQGHVASLRPLAAGRVRRLLVQPGDHVVAGQALAELEVPQLVTQQADLAAAEAQAREVQAGVNVARAALHRADILTADGSMARAEQEQRRLALVQAQAAGETARVHASALRTEIARLNPGAAPGTVRIVTPIAGVVVSVGATPGELLDTAAQVFEVADLSVVLVVAQVPEAGAALVSVGDTARLVQAGRPRTWAGRIVTLGAALDPQTRTLPARILLGNADGALRAGLFLDVVFTTPAGRDGIVIPAASVQTVGSRSVAFTPAPDNHFTVRTLDLGVQRQDWVEVRHGLNEGDQVVTKGSFELKSTLQQALLGGDG